MFQRGSHKPRGRPCLRIRRFTENTKYFNFVAYIKFKSRFYKQAKERKATKRNPSQLSSLLSSSQPQQCRFCNVTPIQSDTLPTLFQMKNPWQQPQPYTNYNVSLQVLINHSLYEKFSSSLIYQYTRDINDILQTNRTSSVILYKFYADFDSQLEWFKSYYSYPYSNQKFPILIEYYKFHNPIPRFFMLPLSLLINQIHDKKRKIEYWKIVKKIQQENLQNPNRPPKNVVGSNPKLRSSSESEEEPKNSISERILDDVSQLPSPKQTKKPESSYKRTLFLDEAALSQPISSQLKQEQGTAPQQQKSNKSDRNQSRQQKQQITKNQLIESLKSQQFDYLKHEIFQTFQQTTPKQLTPRNAFDNQPFFQSPRKRKSVHKSPQQKITEKHDLNQLEKKQNPKSGSQTQRALSSYVQSSNNSKQMQQDKGEISELLREFDQEESKQQQQFQSFKQKSTPLAAKRYFLRRKSFDLLFEQKPKQKSLKQFEKFQFPTFQQWKQQQQQSQQQSQQQQKHSARSPQEDMNSVERSRIVAPLSMRGSSYSAKNPFMKRQLVKSSTGQLQQKFLGKQSP